MFLRAFENTFRAEEGTRGEIGGEKMIAIPGSGAESVRIGRGLLSVSRGCNIISPRPALRAKLHANKSTRVEIHQRAAHALSIEPEIVRRRTACQFLG